MKSYTKYVPVRLAYVMDESGITRKYMHSVNKSNLKMGWEFSNIICKIIKNIFSTETIKITRICTIEVRFGKGSVGDTLLVMS